MAIFILQHKELISTEKYFSISQFLLIFNPLGPSFGVLMQNKIASLLFKSSLKTKQEANQQKPGSTCFSTEKVRWCVSDIFTYITYVHVYIYYIYVTHINILHLYNIQIYSHIQLHLNLFQSSVTDFKRYFDFVPGVLPTTDKCVIIFCKFSLGSQKSMEFVQPLRLCQISDSGIITSLEDRNLRRFLSFCKSCKRKYSPLKA